MAGDLAAELVPYEGPAGQPNRRTRLAADTDPRLRGWLHRAARVHAALANTVRLYGRPGRAGGQSNHGDSYGQRAANGDPSLLADALGLVVDEASELRDEVLAVMDAAPPTRHPPGSRGKVDTMVDRAAAGLSLFVERDGAVDLT